MLRIRECRKRAGVKQEELARVVGLSSITVSRYETGERDPKSADLINIARALGCTVTELIGEEVNPLSVPPAKADGAAV